MENIVVIKCGGSTLQDLSGEFFTSIKLMKDMGKYPVIVHGGGPEIKGLLDELNVQSEFVNGLRKTTKEVMDVVEMVLAGKVNKWLVSKLSAAGLNAVGISGHDSGLLKAVAKNKAELGFVGDVSSVNINFIEKLLTMDIIPVIAPIGIGDEGERYNINADSAAGAIACALKAEQLLFVTDVPGILKNDKLLKELTVAEVQNLISEGTIYGGMIPKVEAALHSLNGELNEVMIVDGKHSAIVNKGQIIGTTIKKAMEVAQ